MSSGHRGGATGLNGHTDWKSACPFRAFFNEKNVAGEARESAKKRWKCDFNI